MTRTSFRSLPVCAAVLLITATVGCLRAARSQAPARPIGLVLVSDQRGERSVDATDLTFVFYQRTYRQKAVPRSEGPSRQRVEVIDQRRENRCFRFADWSKLKFKKLRQIEIRYPPGSREALIRATSRGGKVSEFPASRLAEAGSPMPPRLAAWVGGTYQEFLLTLGDAPESTWPDERLVRILIASSSSRKSKRSRKP